MVMMSIREGDPAWASALFLQTHNSALYGGKCRIVDQTIGHRANDTLRDIPY